MTVVEGVPPSKHFRCITQRHVLRSPITQPNIPGEQVQFPRPSPLPRRRGYARLGQSLFWTRARDSVSSFYTSSLPNVPFENRTFRSYFFLYSFFSCVFCFVYFYHWKTVKKIILPIIGTLTLSDGCSDVTPRVTVLTSKLGCSPMSQLCVPRKSSLYFKTRGPGTRSKRRVRWSRGSDEKTNRRTLNSFSTGKDA